MNTPAEPASPSLAPVWLSHHLVCEADRCVRLGSVPVCRRCLFIAVGFVPTVVLLSSTWRHQLQAGDLGLVLALTIASGIEFIQVARGRLDYNARRVLLLSPPVGASLAWLGVSGVRDGLGPLHFVFAAAALAPLLVLLRNGQRVRRS